MDLTEIISGIIKKRGKQLELKLSDDTDLRDELGFDSIELAELTVRIESVYDVDIFENGIISTIGEIKERLNR